ncbi:2-hydroxyhepta-2,4-diene-1,7-dioate isomerase [Azospirillum cavernae]|uniref:2-hydroxyhepta-2,4-diene-1,7-dioate isomerase n=1 Tax=Azospirillum cavernae TaxID=2320860 RepID=A0A418VPV4_9PROT|nr:fumarylacetoacetate hydrolase family protein [Azospirillum cavernae]RJF78298.1 2-hydroxyhepta-2,4-diene-1,7-dioate isomerase [Azospirillum cavernae]
MSSQHVALDGSGMVYGVILNDRPSLERLGAALTAPPYAAPPKAPVLYIKPYNTHAATGATVRVPRGADRVELGATLGLVLGRDSTGLAEATALDAVAGLRPVLDVSLPNPVVYRPPVRERCFDGSCPMGPVVPYGRVGDLAELTLRTLVNGVLVAERGLSDLLRPAARLLADVTDFMTLRAGDTLTLGIALNGPQAGPGDRVALEIDGFDRLEITIEGAAP